MKKSKPYEAKERASSLLVRAGMSGVQIERTRENLEAMLDFFGNSIDLITASAPNTSEEVFLFEKGEKILTFKCKGDRYEGGYLVIEAPKKKKKKSRVQVL